ncbi:hypothetical protein HK097_001415 [Rhizophlyctis rosea]|uniref:Uncharacterized protein n=1 Tax=Rhizophlyctis rosea TaxID=64517 RepID=A0AAD5S4E9_9FUNG|nr:hypothetical protein HK097_001415 [Rhizophlyctis rosea]
MPLPALPSTTAPLGSAKAEMAKRLESRRAAREKGQTTKGASTENLSKVSVSTDSITRQSDHLQVQEEDTEKPATSPLHDIYFNSQESDLYRSKSGNLERGGDELRVGLLSKNGEGSMGARSKSEDTLAQGVKRDQMKETNQRPSKPQAPNPTSKLTAQPQQPQPSQPFTTKPDSKCTLDRKPTLRIDVPTTTSHGKGPETAPLNPTKTYIHTPGPASAPPRMMYLTNPWDDEVVTLDEEKEKAAAAEFFAKHANLSTPTVPTVQEEDEGSGEEDISYLLSKKEKEAERPKAALGNGWGRDDDLDNDGGTEGGAAQSEEGTSQPKDGTTLAAAAQEQVEKLKTVLMNVMAPLNNKPHVHHRPPPPPPTQPTRPAVAAMERAEGEHVTQPVVEKFVPQGVVRPEQTKEHDVQPSQTAESPAKRSPPKTAPVANIPNSTSAKTQKLTAQSPSKEAPTTASPKADAARKTDAKPITASQETLHRGGKPAARQSTIPGGTTIVTSELQAKFLERKLERERSAGTLERGVGGGSSRSEGQLPPAPANPEKGAQTLDRRMPQVEIAKEVGRAQTLGRISTAREESHSPPPLPSKSEASLTPTSRTLNRPPKPLPKPPHLAARPTGSPSTPSPSTAAPATSVPATSDSLTDQLLSQRLDSDIDR